MRAPVWVRNTAQTTAIALSVVPILMAVPGVVSAHNILRRDLNHAQAPVSGAAGNTALVLGSVAQPISAGR